MHSEPFCSGCCSTLVAWPSPCHTNQVEQYTGPSLHPPGPTAVLQTICSVASGTLSVHTRADVCRLGEGSPGGCCRRRALGEQVETPSSGLGGRQGRPTVAGSAPASVEGDVPIGATTGQWMTASTSSPCYTRTAQGERWPPGSRMSGG